MLRSFSIVVMCTALNSFASTTFDKIQELNGVNLSSVKENEIRSYVGAMETTLPHPIEVVKKGLTNFSDRCNNEYRNKREFIDPSLECKFHHEDIIESFVVKDVRKMDYFKEVSEIFLVGNQTYNRGSYRHYDLVSVMKGQNEKGEKTVTIRVRMLNDKEVKLYTSPKFERESYFDNSLKTFTLTEISPKTTKLTYQYNASTSHWLLKKEILVPQVFATISRSINELVKTVEVESSLRTRELASKK